MMSKETHGEAVSINKGNTTRAPKMALLPEGQTCFSKFSGRNKNTVRLIALITVIGFSFGACGDGTGGNNGNKGTAPTITTEILPAGTVQKPYSQKLEATGNKPIKWSLDSGTLPKGLSLKGTTGEISGTPTTAGTSTFTVKATNAAGKDTESLSITIRTPPTITTSTLPGGKVNTPYSETKLVATGDVPITWSIDSGKLPDGLSLAGTTGVISGTPITAGTATFIVKAINLVGNDTKSLSIEIATDGGGTAPTITTAILPGGTVQTPYNQTLTATGDQPITWWSIDGGKLPDGLSLAGPTGVISGTPTTAATFTFTVKATNAAGNGTRPLSIAIASAAGGGTAPKITTEELSAGVLLMSYSQTLEATGTAPITWSLESGFLPSGLYLDEPTGVISGTPTTTGPSLFTVKATNAAGSDTKEFTLRIANH